MFNVGVCSNLDAGTPQDFANALEYLGIRMLRGDYLTGGISVAASMNAIRAAQSDLGSKRPVRFYTLLRAYVNDTVTWAQQWEELPKGQADVRGYVRHLVEIGYDDWVTVEDFSTARPQEERTAANLAHLRQALAAATSGG